MDNLISIGKMAKVNHTTIATLRLYDKKGILKPKYTDPDTGYRYYSENQINRFDMISYMKERGMSLEEIGNVFKKEDLTFIEEILSKKHEQFHKQMHMLKARHNAVERAIKGIERYRKSPSKNIVTLEYIDRRMIWQVPVLSNFYETGLTDYDIQTENLRDCLMEKGITQVHSYNVCTEVKRENYINGIYIPESIGIIVDPNFEYKNETSFIDSGMYACVYLDNFENEIEYADKLKEHCRNNLYHICGDYLREVMPNFNVFDSEKRGVYLKLQVSVEI